jgi:hypothetical protein
LKLLVSSTSASRLTPKRLPESTPVPAVQEREEAIPLFWYDLFEGTFTEGASENLDLNAGLLAFKGLLFALPWKRPPCWLWLKRRNAPAGDEFGVFEDRARMLLARSCKVERHSSRLLVWDTTGVIPGAGAAVEPWDVEAVTPGAGAAVVPPPFKISSFNARTFCKTRAEIGEVCRILSVE